MLPYDKKLRKLSQNLRNRMTDAEKLLWSRLRYRQVKGYHFYRQKTIKHYIVDFHCPKASLVIEVDGGQHYSEKGMEKDKERDKVLNNMGLKVLRFSDIDVLKDIDAVMECIWDSLS